MVIRVARPARLAPIFVALLAGCTPSGGGTPPETFHDAPSHSIGIQQGAGFFADLAWLTNGWMLVDFDVTPLKPGEISEVWRFHPDGTSFERVKLPNDPSCRQTEYRFPSPIPDGQFAALKTCWAPFDILPVAQEQVIAADPLGGNTSLLVDLHNYAHPGDISWDPKLDRAVASAGSGICATIYWLTRQGVEFPAISIGDGTRSWRLDDPLLQDPNRCGDPRLGRANLPQWSPDGRTIAFLASPQTIGLRDQDRLDARWNLYLMNPTSQKPRVIVSNIAGPRGLTWSPDSHWLAFAGDLPGKGSGTWLLAASLGNPVRLSPDTLSCLTWSPDGQELAGLWDEGTVQFPPMSKVVVLEVRSFTN